MSRKEPLRAVKGMRDILPPESALWNHIEQAAREVFAANDYQEIRTPVLEVTELFARGVGQDTDIVTKEMYTFADRDHQSLTLRPEATASVVRAYIENRMWELRGPWTVYYMGPMFRRERPQKGRYRQFYQIGAEAIGGSSDDYAVDGIIISMAVELLNRLQVTGFSLLLNSVGCQQCRPQYLNILRAELAKVRQQLCEDCQRRSETNPLRVLDCKVPADQSLIESLPNIMDFLCPACHIHFGGLKAYLEAMSIPFAIQPRLVRGLDYYTRTTFEIVHGELGAQNSLLGGGRYDGLSEDLGGPPAPGVGFSIGEDRLASIAPPPEQRKKEFLFIAWLGDRARRHIDELQFDLYKAQMGLSPKTPLRVPREPLALKKVLEQASRLSDRYKPYVLIVGDRELDEERYILRDMSLGEQRAVTKDELLKQFKEWAEVAK